MLAAVQTREGDWAGPVFLLGHKPGGSWLGGLCPTLKVQTGAVLGIRSSPPLLR